MHVPVGDPADPRLADYHLRDATAARRTRAADTFFVLEGPVAIRQALASQHRLRSVLLLAGRVDRFDREIGPLLPDAVPVYVVERDVLAGTVGFDLHRGILASAERRPSPSVADVARASRRIGVLEGLNDAENVGVIARAARALRVDALVLDPSCTDPYARRPVRVSMGEILRLRVARAERWPDDLDVLHAHGFETWALTPAGDAADLWSLPSPPRLALVLGAEGPGLDPRTIRRVTRTVRIPIDPDVDSLNVGHAAAIAFAATGRSAAHDGPT